MHSIIKAFFYIICVNNVWVNKVKGTGTIRTTVLSSKPKWETIKITKRHSCFAFLTGTKAVPRRKTVLLFDNAITHKFDKLHFLLTCEKVPPLDSQGELIVYPSSRRPSVGVRPSTIFKDLLRNRLANQNQILCGASLGRGNQSLYKWSR